ncbi:hypothetical protein CEXT_181761 [Caerostris extrusa]|uniref:Uncharacterized protein n=1 Tax=Caerostris extrusa TaxID=172846 RepID=A0AAV4UV88_CAEEX|nr:hypothetical protein CEXT_181761 [Caerostris extrusa]
MLLADWFTHTCFPPYGGYAIFAAFERDGASSSALVNRKSRNWDARMRSHFLPLRITDEKVGKSLRWIQKVSFEMKGNKLERKNCRESPEIMPSALKLSF